jgi:hypothetical protein
MSVNEIWQVKTAGGEVRSLSLDELDDAFQNGSIDGSALVLAPNATAWERLSDVAGLEEPSPASYPPVALANSIAPISSDQAALDSSDLDLETADLRPKRRGAVVALAAGALVLSGLALAFVRYGGHSADIVVAAAGQSQAVVEANVPAATSPAKPAAETLDVPKGQLTEQQKQRLAEQDKAREAARAARKAKTPAHVQKGTTKASNPFHKGGNKYDPLNSSL